ncbi:MAG: family 43 glycosylhydrolase, partial [Candidatus Eisenbacteria bacterium]
MIPPSPYRAKDFTLVKRGSHYHVFYTRTNVQDPFGQSEKSFGHAVSQDLYHWTQLDTVLTVRPESWDNLHVWAPSIVVMDSVYYMFYTGVSDRPDTIQFHQRIGVATSTDLTTWNRLDYPVFSCSQVPWSFCDSTRVTAGNFRDPFVMPDPDTPGGSLLYYSTVARVDTNRYVVGLASSSGDPTRWVDVKPMEVTDRPVTGQDLAESPHLFPHAGQWYLFFTTSATEPIAWATAPDPTADLPAWTYHGSLASLLGLSTRFWFASEHMSEGTHDYFAFVNFDRVDVREMLWNAGGTFTLLQPSGTHVLSMLWNRDSVETGWSDTLSMKVVNPGGAWARFEVAKLDSVTGVETLIPPSTLGLPDSLPFTDTLTTFVWGATRYADSTGTEGHTRFILRLSDHTASAQTVFVGAGGTCSGGGGDP